LIFFIFYDVLEATYGVDVSSPVYIDTWKCLKSNGYDYAIIRCWQSNGVPDPNCPHTIYNAWDGGMSHVDAYIFPCFSCGNPRGQVQQTINYLNSYNCKYGMLWFDIEAPQLWSSDLNANVNFLSEMMSEAVNNGKRIGIYASQYEWTSIMGNWDGARFYPLWYPHYDGSPSYSDFVPFGGWTSPSMKQFAGDSWICNVEVDQNWYP